MHNVYFMASHAGIQEGCVLEHLLTIEIKCADSRYVT